MAAWKARLSSSSFQFFSGHLAALFFLVLLSWHSFEFVDCARKPAAEDVGSFESSDLEFSDTNHGEVTNTDQQVLYINHGGGATSSIRRNFAVPNQFSPHVNSYPSNLFEGNFPELGPTNYGQDNVGYAPEGDIPRVFERRTGGDGGHSNPPPPPPPPPPSYQPFEAPQRLPPAPVLNTTPLPLPPPPLPFPAALAGPPPGSQSPSPNQHQHNQHVNQLNPSYGLNPYLNNLNGFGGYVNNNGPQQQQHQPQPQQPVSYGGLPPPPPLQQQPPQAGAPDFFNFFESPFGAPPTPLFQRRRLTVQNMPDISHNAIGVGYPAYNYYKGNEEDAAGKWPKIFKFTDGRINLNDFEKDKKLGKVKFAKKDPLFDNVRRDSFLILHGGTYS